MAAEEERQRRGRPRLVPIAGAARLLRLALTVVVSRFFI
jgi:hypothetical protein